MSNGITIEQYRYEEIYPSFKAGTDEKQITAHLNQQFLKRLLGQGIPASGRPLKIADLGCGPCDTILKYLDGLDYAAGFRIRATDFSPEYTNPKEGKAAASLAKAQRDGIIPIVDSAVRQGDSFGGDLLTLLSADGGRDSPNSFDIVFASHMLYHAGSPTLVRAMLNDVLTNLLNDSGMLILYHAAPDPGTLNDFRARYGRRSAVLEKSDTPAVNIAAPAICVADYCARNQVPYFELKFSAKLFVPGLNDEHWRIFRAPHRYAELAQRDPSACENLRRLMFVTQRAPVEFADDRSASGLDAYLAEARSVIESNGGYMELAERLQVICRREAPMSVVDGVRDAMDNLRSASI
jgi:hypothetical protein